MQPAQPTETKPAQSIETKPARQPVAMTTTMVKGQPIKVMDWSRCLKKESVAETQSTQLAEFVEEPKPQPKLNLQPRSRKSPKQDITMESYSEIEAALIQEAKLNQNDNLSLVPILPPPHPQQPQQASSPLLSPSLTYTSQTSSLASSSTVDHPPRTKKNLNFSLGGFGLTEASQPIMFGTGSEVVTPRTCSSLL